MPKKIYIRTFGCQMNVRDSETIAGMLQKRDFAPVQSEKEADIILFNTCSVRQHAEERVWGKTGMIKKKNGRPIIGIVGCMAQSYQDEIFRRLPQVDFVCGPANIYDIPDLVQKAVKEQARTLAVEKEKRPLLCDVSMRADTLKAFVSIMYGCNNFCSYCIVPYVRGRERSRPVEHILNEVRALARTGCREITLLGQNVNSYGKDLRAKINFVGLLNKLDKVEGIERIRFVTSHPKDASIEMCKAMCDLPKVCEHLHLPLQSGSDKVLRLMNRKYTLKHYIQLVERLRKLIPECALTTDIIVGFPGESDGDFGKTYRAMEEIQFDQAFIFKYSARPKTKAARLQDVVPCAVKIKRNHQLLALQQDISLQKNKQLVGTSQEVLTEGRGSYFVQNTKKVALRGRTRTNKVVLFPGKRDLISHLLRVKIERVTTHTLIGKVDGKKS